VQQRAPYSITSPARPSSERNGEAERLCRLEVEANSTFVTCSTGRSAAFSPLRNAACVGTDSTEGVRIVRSVRHEPPS
jgi:hypothetical protein